VVFGTKIGGGGVGIVGAAGTKFGYKLRGKSSAAIQVRKALGGEKSISRLKPTTQSEKRRGRRLRRQ